MLEELVRQAQAGDAAAFEELVAHFRRELHVHCYRILGSLQDAEDAVQETLLAAWRGVARFERRASFRGWLYAVATNRCLNMLRASSRRPRTAPDLGFDPPQPAEPAEPLWLEPYPDLVLDDGALASSPEARYEAKESLSLAFVAALQLLPARQRAVLILRDVLGFRAGEVAAMLDATEESVTSALKRARATLDRRLPPATAPAAHSPAERELVGRLTDAFVANDVDAIVAVLAEDVRLSMPPLPLEYRGLAQAALFFTQVAPMHRDCRVSHTRANGQPAIVVYARDPSAPLYRALGLLVLTLAGDRISAITRFDPGLLPRFALPRTLPL